MSLPWEYPEKQGLYDPSYETAACGVGFVVNIDGESSPKAYFSTSVSASALVLLPTFNFWQGTFCSFTDIAELREE
ncbi:hypothetical protein HAZT_HAZT009284 [Hyalella azteca]|uniref:Glutamine amidotransferase type-2 domain-containing protein n=1 Tax=Hyalella azteca TaxID=294128 RepID=A0A6A0H9R7_HYAAZ|nr:hypothetical protein HAZT_HAZT009284 [Hyalella azteca]